MLLLIFALWPAFQIGAALLALAVPAPRFHYDSFFFRAHSWEREGRVYERFGIKRWKKYLPDGAAAFKNGYRKKHLTDFSPSGLETFLAESCRAELSHWLAILPFFVFGFFCPPIVIPLMFLYAVMVNLPCILAQRYNRPRILKICRRLPKRPHSCPLPPL